MAANITCEGIHIKYFLVISFAVTLSVYKSNMHVKGLVL